MRLKIYAGIHHNIQHTKGQVTIIAVMEKARSKRMNEYIMECIRCLGIKFLVEDDTIKVKWRHYDKHYIVPLGGLLELWEKYEEQDG